MSRLPFLLFFLLASNLFGQSFHSLSPYGESLFEERVRAYPAFNEAKALAEASAIRSDSEWQASFVRKAREAYYMGRLRKLMDDRAELLRKYPAVDERRLASLFERVEPSARRFALMNETASFYDSLLPLEAAGREPIGICVEMLLKRHPELALENSKVWIAGELANFKARRAEAAAKRLWRAETRRLMPKAATPEFEPDGGQFDPLQPVRILCPTPGASIHYTTDGSEPDESSPLYTAPLKLRQAVRLKAVAVHPEMNDSEAASSAPWTGLGLYASYFDRLGFTGTTSTRIDPELDFNWACISPAPAIPADFFSAVWAGSLCAPESGDYTLYILAGDGVWLWVNGRLLIDSWSEGVIKDRSANVRLEAGRPANVKIAYAQFVSMPKIRFDWSSATLRRSPVPASSIIAKGGYTDELLRWNERQGGAYVNRTSMQNPGTVDGSPLLKGVSELQPKVK